jgi:hypothetical protein
MIISGVFLLCALPIVSVGWAWGIAITLGRREAEELKLQCFRVIRGAFCKRGLVFLLMGILDLCAAFLLAAAIITLIRADIPFIVRAANALFFWIDFVMLCSGMYRYPLAVFGEGLPLSRVYAKSLLLVFSRPGQTFLFVMVFITIFIVSILAGITLFFFLPGAAAMLSVYIYRGLINQLPPEE